MPDPISTTGVPAAPQAQRGRAQKKPTLISRIMFALERLVYPLAFITGVFGIAYWYGTTTPQYAVAAAIMSTKDHDTKQFEKYVDVDSIAGRAFDTVVDGPARAVLMGRYQNMIGAGFLHFFKNDVVGMAHDRTIDFIATNRTKIDTGAGTWLIMPFAFLAPKELTIEPHKDKLAQNPNAAYAGEIGSSDKKNPVAVNNSTESDEALSDDLGTKTSRQLKDFGLDKNGFRGYYFDQQSNWAILGLKFHSPKLNEDWVAEFKLEDAGGYWRVTEVANLNQLIEKYLALREQHKV